MRILSWNVNGLRAVLRKGFEEFLAGEDADLVCLQETRLSDDLTGGFEFPGYRSYWNCAEKKGYSGTAVLAREEPLKVRRGIGVRKHDREGRVLTLEFDRFQLVNVYTPNAQNHDEQGRPRRLDYRAGEWDVAFRRYVRRLDQAKPVVICGDLNVAHREIDLARPKDNRRNAGFTDEERNGFGKLLKAGFADSFRHLHPDARDCYSWWSFRGGARARNVGWRIDYVCLSEALLPGLTDAFILDSVTGSDHCPVGVEIRIG